jgi:outer membrane protein assembly factor BamB
MKRSIIGIQLALAACLIAATIFHPSAVTASGGSNWAQWRGPAGQGISTEKNLPIEWSPTKNVKWKTAIEGRGHSSPIVWGNRIFLTTSIEGPVVASPKPPKHKIGEEDFSHPDWAGIDHTYTLKVVCIDADKGKLLWQQTAYDGPVFDYRHKKNTYASSTPVTDGQYVYAYFGSEGLYCYDFNGKLIWKQSFGGIPQLGMGPGTSPVLHENLLFLQCDLEADGNGSFLVALDKKTGKQVWKVERKGNRMSWATPVIVRTPERVQLVASGAEAVISYDPATGKEIWRSQGVVSHAIPSPVFNNEMIFLTAGSQAKRAFAVKLGATGNVTGTPNVAWTYEKGTAYVPSPILYGDYLYLTTDRGILTCLEAATGKVVYEGGRVPIPATFTASPVAFDGKILLSSEDGDTFVVKAGPKHEILYTNSIGEPIYASPAISNARIFIRGEKNLYCIGGASGK